MIIAGAVILYVTVILFGVDENIASDSTVNDLCHGRVWLSVIGFSLLYGTMFAKVWKIYYTEKNSKLDQYVCLISFLLYRKLAICGCL